MLLGLVLSPEQDILPPTLTLFEALLAVRLRLPENIMDSVKHEQDLKISHQGCKSWRYHWWQNQRHRWRRDRHYFRACCLSGCPTSGWANARFVQTLVYFCGWSFTGIHRLIVSVSLGDSCRFQPQEHFATISEIWPGRSALHMAVPLILVPMASLLRNTSPTLLLDPSLPIKKGCNVAECLLESCQRSSGQLNSSCIHPTAPQ